MFNISMFSMMFTDWMRISNFELNQPTKDCITAYHLQFMNDFELWLADNEDQLLVECAESGADHEYGFNIEQYMEDAYFESTEELP